MENSDELRAAAYTESLLRQLAIEITAADTTVKDLAGRLGRDYNTFRRWANGERDMPLHVIVEAAVALGVEPNKFFARAAERMQ